jgi:hypothetical protein
MSVKVVLPQTRVVAVWNEDGIELLDGEMVMYCVNNCMSTENFSGVSPSTLKEGI